MAGSDIRTLSKMIFLCLAVLLAPAAGANVVEFDEASMTWADRPLSPGALPDRWRTVELSAAEEQRPDRQAAYAWYRFQFDYRPDPATIYAIQINRIGGANRILLNGTLIYSVDDPHRFFHVRGMVPRFIQVAPGTVTDGVNRLWIEKAVGQRSRLGMSAVRFGPAADLEPGYQAYVFFTETLRTLLNIAALIFGVLMLQIWYARKSEVAIGLFGFLCVLNSTRMFLYFSEQAWVTRPFFDWFFFAVNAVTPLILGLFAMHFSGHHNRLYRTAIITIAALFSAVSAWAVWAGFMEQVRLVTYPFILLACLPAAALLLRKARRSSEKAVWGLALSLGLAVLAATHDYFFSQGLMPVLDTIWMGHMLPLMFLAFGAHLISGMVRAAGELEKLNLTLEDRVARRTHDLEQASAAKTRFLASASHDLRQPTHTISLLVGLLRAKVAEPALLLLIRRIDRAVSSMEDLLKGLLDLSRLDAGVVVPEFYPVRVNEIFQAVRNHLGPEAEAKGLRLRFRATDRVVRTDPMIFERVIRNLVANAVQHTDAGGVLIGVRRAGTGQVRVEVHDTGVGIPEDQLSLIFQEFYQVGNAERHRSKGLGLGLSITQRSVRLLKHELRVRSCPGRGSSFTLILPGWRAEQRAPDQAAPVDTPSLAGRCIALVEDEEDVRHGMTGLLEHMGGEVVAAAGLEGLRAALARHGRGPDIVISDFRLEGADGLTVIDRMRARYGPALPALLLTGDTAPGQVQRIKASGVAVLFKPCGAGELSATLRDLLR